MKRILLAASMLVLFAIPASAQRPGQTDIIVPFSPPTYWASAVNITPAASQTDYFVITGSATKTVTVKHLDCTATSTAAGSYISQLVIRTTANTGGTSAAATAVKADSNNSAATAVVKSYTVVPTGLGTGTAFLTEALTSGPAATVQITPSFSFDFGTNYTQPIVLHGVAQSLAINGLATSMVAGSVFSCTVSWTEQ